MNFIMVASGGAVGASLRYLISLIPFNTEFPLATFITNMLGAVIIGFVVGSADSRGLNDKMLLFLKTGVCGGFTTFSTFSLESYNLLSDGRTSLALIYMLLSVALSLVGIMLGLKASGKVSIG